MFLCRYTKINSKNNGTPPIFIQILLFFTYFNISLMGFVGFIGLVGFFN